MTGSTGTRLVRFLGAFLLLAVAAGGFIMPGAVSAHDDPHPAHIHVGECPAPGSVVAPLTDVAYLGDDGAVALSDSSVELTLEAVLAEPHAIVVHESADNMGNYILCGDITGDSMDGSLTVALSELNGSGHAGVAMLTGTDTGMEVSLITVEDATATGMIHHDADVAHPSHIHDGSCDASAGVVFPLSDFTGSGGVESSITDVETTLADLTAAPHAIIAHASSDDMGTYIICGDVTGEPVDGVLTVALGELNGSGHVGVAVLTESDAGVQVQAHLFAGAAGGEMMGDASPDADDDHEMGGMDAMGGEEIEAAIEGFAFVPGTIEIKVGTTITWTNNDSAPHTVTANDRSFDSGRMEQGQTFSFTFEEAGSFDYFCEYHPGMSGTIVVTE